MKNLFTILLFLGGFMMSSVLYAQEPLEPRFPGCPDAEDYDCADMKMLQFIFSNLKHPEEAKAAGISGIVVVKFNVGADGSLQSPSIVEGLGHGCDEEVIRVVGLMPKWLPATDEGGATVDMEWEIEVKFK